MANNANVFVRFKGLTIKTKASHYDNIQTSNLSQTDSHQLTIIYGATSSQKAEDVVLAATTTGCVYEHQRNLAICKITNANIVKQSLAKNTYTSSQSNFIQPVYKMKQYGSLQIVESSHMFQHGRSSERRTARPCPTLTLGKKYSF
ncbi:hypothetical protein H5410_043024 [Solanum commersonii]|uniref:Uncharacterized protein n=1 Tax=Solanum commersonii TaxID=4109 RepID=A0A9J5Y097_SOLCO|nr:hypothetical protein H5410_043024 [Solanum commersonii]